MSLLHGNMLEPTSGPYRGSTSSALLCAHACSRVLNDHIAQNKVPSLLIRIGLDLVSGRF